MAEAEAVEAANHVALDDHLALGIDRCRHRRAGIEPANEGRRTHIDEPLGEPLMQRVRQPVLDRPGALLPLGGVLQPVAAVGNVGPGADRGDAPGERVDVAVGAVDMADLLCDPVRIEPAAGTRQRKKDLAQKPRVMIAENLPEVRDLTDFPQERYGLRPLRAVLDVLLLRQRPERLVVVRLPRALQKAVRRRRLERAAQMGQRMHLQVCIPPEENAERRERVALHRRDRFFVHRPAVAGGAEGAVIDVAPGAARDLRNLGVR